MSACSRIAVALDSDDGVVEEDIDDGFLISFYCC